MGEFKNILFDIAVWGPALDKYGAVVRMSVSLYGATGQRIYGPAPDTSLVATFEKYNYDPGLFAECVRTCLAQTGLDRPAVVLVAPASGLAVVGVSLALDGQIIGAMVAGYALINFCESLGVARLARQSGTPFGELWAVVRRQQPTPKRRLVLNGELLQVLGDALLRENALRQHADETAGQLSHQASHDPLTDLPNRALLADRLAHALALAKRHQRRLAVLFLDIDRFKHINDTLGHLIGDELLRTIARELTICIRSSDTVGRQGGDEFVVVLSELAHREDAAKAAQKILAALARPHQISGHDVCITVSIGISVFPGDGDDAETLLTCADMALYHAKDHGRDRCQFFEPRLNVRAVERQLIELDLHRALAKGEFELVYQPKVNLKTRALVGAEALIRWRHPERGLIEPAVFVPIAEDCGLIAPIGRWVVQEACRQARAWQDGGLLPMPISINASAVEFRSQDFLENIVDALKKTELAPYYLEIELTETVLMANVEVTNSVLRALKTLGVQLAIDDFGTGWSSLSYLMHFPVDTLKIDKSLVHEIVSSSQAAPIVSAVISLANSLNLRVIAEGVETPDQLTFLQDRHCGEAQGYYFSRPLFAQQFAQLLEAETSGGQPVEPVASSPVN